MPNEQPERRRMIHSTPSAGGLRGAAGAAAWVSGDRRCPEHTRKLARRRARFIPITYPLHAHSKPALYPFHACNILVSCPQRWPDFCPFHVRKLPGGMPGHMPVPCPCLEAVS